MNIVFIMIKEAYNSRCSVLINVLFFVLSIYSTDEMTDSFMQNAKSEGPPPPEWVIVGESVLIRPYNTSGVVCFIGPTHFQVGYIIEC